MAERKLDVIVATDCGSTTTKAILIERKPEGYRQTFRGEAPTTVEAPFEDVTKGVLNSMQELEELSGRKIVDWAAVDDPKRDPYTAALHHAQQRQRRRGHLYLDQLRRRRPADDGRRTGQGDDGAERSSARRWAAARS